MDLSQQMALEIRILSNIITKTSRQALEQHMAEKGVILSMLQFGIIHLLHHHTFTSSELSKKMVLDPSTLVPAVEGLVQKGYIYKERDPNDRRRYLLYLTDAAHEFLSDMHAVTEDDPLLIAVAELGEADSKQLLHLLRKVIQTIPQGENMLCEIQTRLNPQKIAPSELD